ncbi:MAG: DUF885 domain-containing protein [Hyphomonadaceae bacterium]|nr:DUF885 domain-containing protein [Hyphomonadaceae bacterium]
MRIGTKLKALALGGAALMALSACDSKPATPPVAAVDWGATVNEWIESDLKANPDFAVYQGRHEYDGVMPDWSEAGLKAEVERLHTWKTRVEGIDAAALTDPQKFERDYVLANIDGSLFFLEAADWPHKNPTFYSIDPGVYLDRPYADPATRMKALAKWASNVPAALENAKANLKGPMPRAYIDIGVASFGPLADFVKKDVVEAFKGQGDEVGQAELVKATGEAAAAFTGFAAYLESLRGAQTEDFAMGADMLSKMLYATERVDASLDELEAIGLADLKRNQEALAEACKAFAPGKSIQDCVAKEEASKPDGGDFVGYATKQLVDLKQFLIDKNVVSIPGEEEAKVKQSPPYNAQNGAYIDIPGPFEKNMPSYYNIAAPDPKWSKAKQLAYVPGKANLLFTSVHEVWPGHFLQFLHSNRSESIFGKLYVGYAFAEGWAHYTEEMMWEEGLGNGDPETHIGQLTNATLRNVRFLSAIGMHAKGMTLAESKKMFMEEGYQDEGTAEQQSARGAYDPAYLNYTMGKLMIRKLREDWCAAKGGTDPKACWKDFHDAFLSYGGPPIPLVRGAMMKEAPKAVF